MMGHVFHFVPVCSLLACALPASGCAEDVPVHQPMAMSHKRHMEANMKCISCHPGAETEAWAQFPTVSDCMDCHGKVLGSHPDEPKVRLYAERREEIPWVRVDRLSGHVYFSHAVHVSLADMKCEACHVDLRGVGEPLTLPDLHLTMASCMSCHRQRKANNQCTACHK
jgi:c(7)-type cytochrome triheme protein